MKTTEIVRDSWPLVLAHYGLPGETGNRHINCPICEKKKSFRISKYNGSLGYICTCGNGDIWSLLKEVTRKEFKTLAREIDELLGNTFKADKPVIRKKSTAVDRFKRLAELRGTQAEEYLKSREIYELPRKGVRYSPDSGMVAVVTDEFMEPSYLHITYLNGSKKINRKQHAIKPKEQLEYAKSLAVRMFEVQSTLGIAEGIETALSAKSIYKCPTWSVINTSIMKRFIAPQGVEHLMIFADTDSNGAGHAAAFECGHRNILKGPSIKRVTILWPEKGDFNDMMTEGRECYKWELTK